MQSRLRLLCCVFLHLSGLGVLSAPTLDVILYGATGCVGHFAAEHLAKQPGLRWAIAGRTKDKLQALLETLQAEGANASIPEIIVADLAPDADIRSWVSRSRVVLSAAGPFSVHGGEWLVKACAEAGVHYADTSDEFYWQRQMIDSYHPIAARTGAKVVFAGGFCVLAGDLGSQLALEGLSDEEGATADDSLHVDAWLETYNGGLSAGVINTGKAIMNASYPKEWATDPYVLAPKADPSLRVDTSVEGMSFPAYVRGEGLVVANLFGPYDARLLRRAFTLLGQKVKFRVGAAASMYAKWTAFIASHPGSWSKLAQCPSRSVFNDGSWAYRFKAKAASGKKSREVLLSGKGDPGYRFTAHGLAEVGLCLAGQTSGCMKARAPGGIMTSMPAFNAEALQQRLESVGLLNPPKVKERVARVRTLK